LAIFNEKNILSRHLFARGQFMKARLKTLFSFIAVITVLAAGPVASAKQKGADTTPLPPNEVNGKASSSYLQLSRMHMSVLVDRNRQYRSLELEVWLQPTDEENLALARSQKKAIMAGLQEDFSNYDWEAFQDSKKGPDIAKKIVASVVERVSGAKLQDVFIKTLLLR
jgi:hypothetical protein